MVATASPKLWMYPEAAEPSAYLQPIVVFVERSAKFALARSSSLFAVGRREVAQAFEPEVRQLRAHPTTYVRVLELQNARK